MVFDIFIVKFLNNYARIFLVSIFILKLIFKSEDKANNAFFIYIFFD